MRRIHVDRVAEDSRNPIASNSEEPSRAQRQQDYCGNSYYAEKTNRLSFDRRSRVSIAHDRIRNRGDEKCLLLAGVQPASGLKSRTEEAGRREGSGKRQSLRDEKQRSEQKPARQHEQSPIPGDRKLRQQ